MTDAKPELVVIGPREVFSDFWSELADLHALSLHRLEAPEPVSESRAAAVILVCAGRENHALEILHDAQRAGIDAPIVVGAKADHRLAVELMRRGASIYYALPDDAERLEEEIAQRGEPAAPTDEPALADLQRESYDFSAIIGEDETLRSALERAARVIPRGQATVLITGETGTGKELLAKALHYNGPRRNEAFVAVNCSAIPGNLLESELFGHEKGAFTDARTSKPGLFQVADGGSLFLDEIATLPVDLQGKLLRVLESGEVRRVGGLKSTSVDVRIIAATNVDLRKRVGEGEFREDLYYRLAVIPIHLPPLRERGSDVRRLARHFLVSLAEEYGVDPPELTADSIRVLEAHSWPGNVRELRNAVERALLLSDGRPIRPQHLAVEETSPAGERGERVARGGGPELPFPATLEELETEAIRRMIDLCDGNKSEAARRLGISRSRLYRTLDRIEESGPEDEGEPPEPGPPAGEPDAPGVS